ncbi:MAG: hypothetical protein BWY67_00360 [Bacteroidetes bacterium ADurb.Bin397]|jgi:hypothetical protein|nr:hypothetical protein [Bacteroidia bacterium]OQA12355.1 MAG: hypothetical protein BWY67_00360 [Bacteroidetes bacterium ADurb.Bin397]
MGPIKFNSLFRIHSVTISFALKKRKLNFLIVIFIFNIISAKAQTPLDANLSINNNTGIFSLVIPDSTNISEIELQIGSNENPTEVFEHIFIYDQTSGLPNGLSFSRSGVTINLGLGTITPLNIYHVKTRLKNGSGDWSDWYEFVGN